MFDFYPDFLQSSLKMGVDVDPDTDPESVPHTRTPGYTPVYSYQTWDGEEWSSPVDIPLSELPEFVDRMHWDFKQFVRLMEDGYQVFGCELI